MFIFYAQYFGWIVLVVGILEDIYLVEWEVAQQHYAHNRRTIHEAKCPTIRRVRSIIAEHKILIDRNIETLRRLEELKIIRIALSSLCLILFLSRSKIFFRLCLVVYV